MRYHIFFILLLFSIYTNSQTINSTNYQQKRINIALEKIFVIPISSDTIFSDENHIYYKVLKNEKLVGYYVFSKAYAMSSRYDYYYITSVGFKILSAEVLTFRSIKGGQIKNKDWLSQFIGYDGNKTLEYGVDIDAISGATKSAISIIDDIRFSLEKMKNYKQK